jgi:hypothetical protein
MSDHFPYIIFDFSFLIARQATRSQLVRLRPRRQTSWVNPLRVEVHPPRACLRGRRRTQLKTALWKMKWQLITPRVFL